MAHLKIKLETYQQLFFTSDTHYNHANICEGTTNWVGDSSKLRSFQTLFGMNQALVSNINEVVGENDILMHLGDWSFGGFDSIREFRNRINCKNIYLVLGNHDHHIRKNKDNIQNEFLGVFEYLTLEVTVPIHDILGGNKKYNFVLSHFPIASWDGLSKGVTHLFGHVHLPNHLKIQKGRATDVGVDGNSLHPYGLPEIIKIMKNQPIKSMLAIDHHENI